MSPARFSRFYSDGVAFLAGMLYGTGFALAELIDPTRMLAFLDLSRLPEGTWHGAPAAVFFLAMLVVMVGIRIGQRLRKPLLGPDFVPLPRDVIDRRLIGGAILFGAGWGLSGTIPSTALAALLLIPQSSAIFLASVLAGTVITDLVLLKQGSDTANTAKAQNDKPHQAGEHRS